MDDDLVERGARIRAARVAKGMSQRKLAAEIRKLFPGARVTGGTISRIEAGESGGHRRTIRLIAAALESETADVASAESAKAVRMVPIGAEIDPADGTMSGPSAIESAVGSRGLHYAGAPLPYLPVLDAESGWFVARVVDGPQLVVSVDPGAGRTAVHELRTGDLVVFRPAEPDEDVAGKLVQAVSDDLARSELRACRRIDGQMWAWRTASSQAPERLDDGWTVRAIAVRQERTL